MIQDILVLYKYIVCLVYEYHTSQGEIFSEKEWRRQANSQVQYLKVFKEVTTNKS